MTQQQRDRNAIMGYTQSLLAIPIPPIESSQLRAAFHEQRVNLLTEIYGLEEMVIDEPQKRKKANA